MLLPAEYHKDCQAAFGRCEPEGDKDVLVSAIVVGRVSDIVSGAMWEA